MVALTPRQVDIQVPVENAPENINQATGEPTNAVRCARVDALMMAYAATKGEVYEEEETRTGPLELASVLADIRHWCDEHGIDFYKAEKLSYQHYLEENVAEAEAPKQPAATKPRKPSSLSM